MAALAASQQNDTASPAARAAAISAAQQKAQAALMLQNTKSNYDELTNFASNSFDKIGSDITQAFTQGATAAKSFGDIGNAIISDLSQEILKLAVINPLKKRSARLKLLPAHPERRRWYREQPVRRIECFLNSRRTAICRRTGVRDSGRRCHIFHEFRYRQLLLQPVPRRRHRGYGSGSGMRMVDPSIFFGAQRLHNGGIAGDEVPTVLKAGEGVFTPGQMSALGAGAAANSNSGDTHFNFNVNAQGAGPREIDTLKTQIPLIALQAVQSAATRGGSFAKALRGS